MICFGQTILDPLVRRRRLCAAALAASASGLLRSVVAAAVLSRAEPSRAGPAHRPRGPGDRRCCCAGRTPKRVFREIRARAGACEASRTEEVTALTAKQHFPSHAHTSPRLKIITVFFKRSLLCKTHTKKESHTMKCITDNTTDHVAESHRSTRQAASGVFAEQSEMREITGTNLTTQGLDACKI